MEKTAVLNWDVEDVLEKLRTEKFDLSVIEAFQREAIDGSSLIALTSDDLKEMNLKLGHKKKVELLIKSFQETLVPSPVATPPVPVLNTQTPPQLEPQASTSFVSSTLAATSSLGASQVTGAPLTTSTSTSDQTSTVSVHATQEQFGVIQTSKGDESVIKYTLTNLHGVKVQLITYGAALTNLLVPDKEGKLEDVVLGFDDLDGYRGAKARNPYFGSTVGRVANRIAKGRFNLDGIDYQLATNNGANHLHGGLVGFDKVVWRAHAHRNGSVTFTYSSPHMEEGYPGQLSTQVTYTLTDSNELMIDFKALTDLPTPVNLANHAYFNLGGHEAGSQQLYNHRVQLYADRYTPVDDEKIPTGELASVNGTAFDLRSETRLGDVIHLIPGGGYDHNFVAGHSGRKSYHTNLPLVAKFWHPPSGRLMKVFSNQPGFQLYTGNVLPADDSLLGKNGRFYHTHDGFCVETQNFPDAINQPNFADSVLRPGTVYHRTTVFKFSIK